MLSVIIVEQHIGTHISAFDFHKILSAFCTSYSFSLTKEVRDFLLAFLFVLCLVVVRYTVLSGFVIESVVLGGICEESFWKK